MSASSLFRLRCAQKREAAARREQKWQSKLARSPFHVDLVAEQERVDEVCRGVYVTERFV